ncbi:MAG: hypothetical protein AB8D78_12700 [Akkermansiaceae bacterium]
MNYFKISGAIFSFLVLFTDLSAQVNTSTKDKDSGTLIRILCVRSLIENDQIILATKTEDGDWREHEELTLRSPFITDWTKVPKGTVHLTRKAGEQLTSVGSFNTAQNLKRAILVLRPDQKENMYRATKIDPKKLDFANGKALVINYSKTPAIVKLGGKQFSVKPGQKIVERMQTEDDRMFRMLVGYRDESQKIIPCYDRYVSGNPKTRKFLLLFPDPSSRIRVFSLSEFGPFE